MDGLTLLRDARAAGLSVRTEGERLVIRGPRRAEPVVHVLIAHKPDIMAALALAGQAGELNPPALSEAAGNVAQRSGLYREKLQVWQGAGRYTEAGPNGLLGASFSAGGTDFMAIGSPPRSARVAGTRSPVPKRWTRVTERKCILRRVTV